MVYYGEPQFNATSTRSESRPLGYPTAAKRLAVSVTMSTDDPKVFERATDLLDAVGVQLRKEFPNRFP